MARLLIDSHDGGPSHRDRDEAIATLVDDVRGYGQRWLADEWDFVRVTLATEAAKRRLAALERPAPHAAAPGRVLVSAMPGDQHDFGIRVVALRLREAGWAVIDTVPADGEALARAVAAERPDAVCLSIGHDRALVRAGELVARLRRAAGSRRLCVALGGPMLNGDPESAAALGADVHADDAAAVAGLLAARLPVPA